MTMISMSTVAALPQQGSQGRDDVALAIVHRHDLAQLHGAPRVMKIRDRPGNLVGPRSQRQPIAWQAARQIAEKAEAAFRSPGIWAIPDGANAIMAVLARHRRDRACLTTADMWHHQRNHVQSPGIGRAAMSSTRNWYLPCQFSGPWDPSRSFNPSLWKPSGSCLSVANSGCGGDVLGEVDQHVVVRRHCRAR